VASTIALFENLHYLAFCIGFGGGAAGLLAGLTCNRVDPAGMPALGAPASSGKGCRRGPRRAADHRRALRLSTGATVVAALSLVLAVLTFS